MTDNCNICYFPIETNSVTCFDENCNCIICNDCLDIFLEYLKEENNIPICPFNNCKGQFLYSDIRKCKDEDIVAKYEVLVINFLKNNKKDEHIDKKICKLIIEKIREHRHKFILKTFPVAINKVIELSLKPKLKKVNKKNMELVNKATANDVNKCSNIFCYMGTLDADNICLLCAGLGAHDPGNSNLHLTDDFLTYLQAQVKAHDSKFLELLKKIENLKPVTYSFDKILTLLKKYLDGEVNNLVQKIVIRYEKYKLSQTETHNYNQYMTKIHEWNENDELDIDKLTKVYNSLISE